MTTAAIGTAFKTCLPPAEKLVLIYVANGCYEWAFLDEDDVARFAGIAAWQVQPILDKLAGMGLIDWNGQGATNSYRAVGHE